MDDDEDRMADGDRGPLRAASGGESVVLRCPVGSLATTCCTGGFDQCRAEPGAAFARLATPAFACALVIPWAHAGPACQVSGGGEAAHVGADLGEEHFGGALPYARDRCQSLQLRRPRAEPLGDLHAHCHDGGVQEVDVGQLLGQQEPLVRTDPPREGPLQRRQLVAQTALG